MSGPFAAVLAFGFVLFFLYGVLRLILTNPTYIELAEKRRQQKERNK